MLDWRATGSPNHQGFKKILNLIRSGLKKILKSLKFNFLKPADTLKEERAQMHPTKRCWQNVLVFLAKLLRFIVCSSLLVKSYINQLDFSGKLFIIKKNSRELKCCWRASMTWWWNWVTEERKHGCGNPTVSMATVMLTELSPPHLGIIAAIIKETSCSVPGG